MPEGPEIRRAADRVEKALVGERLVAVELHLPGLVRFGKRLVGEQIERIDTHGKAMLTRFSGGLTLYSHNQLYGRWRVISNSTGDPETNRQLRVALRTSERSALLYSATDVELLDEESLVQHEFLRRAGPDVLWPETSVEEIAERLRSRRFARRNFAGLLLDQSFVAGLGNYLRSEILFVAGIAPSARASDLDEERVSELATAIVEVTRRAYRTGGVTVKRELAARLRADGWNRRRDRFYVFGRDGRPCRGCGTEIERRILAGRRLYLCPSRQSNGRTVCQP